MTMAAGGWAQLMGAIMASWGSFYAQKTAAYAEKGQAKSLEFQAAIADRNARMAEVEAQDHLRAGRQEVGRVTLAAGQAKAQRRASAAAAGIELGVGSEAEVDETLDFFRDLDVLQVRSNAVRRSIAAREEGMSQRIDATMRRVSARNLRASARSRDPYLAKLTSLLGSSSQIAPSWQASTSSSSRNTSWNEGGMGPREYRGRR